MLDLEKLREIDPLNILYRRKANFNHGRQLGKIHEIQARPIAPP